MKNANGILFIVLILLTVLAWILPPFTTGIKHNKEAGIGEKVFLEIGGIKQGMIIRGNDMQNPILLFYLADIEKSRKYCKFLFTFSQKNAITMHLYTYI